MPLLPVPATALTDNHRGDAQKNVDGDFMSGADSPLSWGPREGTHMDGFPSGF